MATASFTKDYSASFGVEYENVDQDNNKEKEEVLLAKLASA